MKNGYLFKGVTKNGRRYLVCYPEITDVSRTRIYMNKLSKEQTYVKYQGEEISLKQEDEYLKEYFRRAKKDLSVQLLVLSDEDVIGIATFDLDEGASSHEGVLEISVLSEYRGEGIGSLLLDLIIFEAQKKLPKLEIITLSVFAENSLAYGLYKKKGFKEFGRLPEGLFYKNKYQDKIYMFKNLKKS